MLPGFKEGQKKRLKIHTRLSLWKMIRYIFMEDDELWMMAASLFLFRI
jgi:hypothetical protein